MDYIFFATLASITLLVFLTYDIVCQYHKNLLKRMQEFPSHMQLPEQTASQLQFAIPKKHWPCHGPNHSKYSLNYMPKCGRTYGEGVESGWSHMNPVAASTKEMAPSARIETINMHWSAWNHQKTLGFGELYLFQ